jgi:hypothetical protein
VKALAVGHFDEHSHDSTDVHTLVDGLAEAVICLHNQAHENTKTYFI